MAAIAYPRAPQSDSVSGGNIPIATCVSEEEELQRLHKEIEELKKQLKTQRQILNRQKKKIAINGQSRSKTMKIIAEAVQKFKEYENIVKTLRIRINKSEAENKMLSKENVKLNDEISTDVASKNLVNFVLKSYKEKATVREKKIQDLSNEISNQKAEIQILSNIISSIRNLLHQATFRTYSKKVEN
jgi:chromosome segregation ATPase